jgi:putative SOS response-associated peptidase YedK
MQGLPPAAPAHFIAAMCNDYRYRLPLERLIDEFAHVRIPLRFPTGRPNIEPRDDIKITDRGALVRPDEGGGAALSVMRWSWPGPTGKPVYNFRSEGRRFGIGRCLIPADGFYEFTAPEDPKQKRKDKWLFTLKGSEVFAIAGYWKPGAAGGEDAWTMLTCEPGPDVAPYHDRQVVILPPAQWSAWLNGEGNEAELLRPLPGGSLAVDKVS